MRSHSPSKVSAGLLHSDSTSADEDACGDLQGKNAMTKLFITQLYYYG